MSTYVSAQARLLAHARQVLFAQFAVPVDSQATLHEARHLLANAAADVTFDLTGVVADCRAALSSLAPIQLASIDGLMAEATVDPVDVAGIREQVRALMGAAGVRIIELLGPGDRGHDNHWHLAFARPGQIIDRLLPVEGDEDWVVDVAEAGPARPMLAMADAAAASGATAHPDGKAPPPWDVFAAAEWRGTHGGGS